MAFAALAVTATAPATWAQDAGELSAQELADKFAKQKTRGLVLVPSGTDATTTQPTTETTTAAADPAPVTTETQTTVTAAAYQPVEKEDQINVQIAFDFDSAALRDDMKPVLNKMCDVMKSVDVSVFQIIGHTDSAGPAAYNENLSLLRAQEVKRFLTDDCGIDAVRLQAIGLGESAPFNEADPRADENRRVEFQALG